MSRATTPQEWDELIALLRQSITPLDDVSTWKRKRIKGLHRNQNMILEAVAGLAESIRDIERRMEAKRKPKPKHSVEAGPVPDEFKVAHARLALAEKAPVGHLKYAFLWSKTVQDSAFWQKQYRHGLTDKGRAILQTWIAETEKGNGS